MRKLALFANVPNFVHPDEGQCGYYCIQFILEAKGKGTPITSWIDRAIGILPKRMTRLLIANNQEAEVTHVQHETRIYWLRKQINTGRIVVLFVQPREHFSFVPHWVVACGMEDDRFYIYDMCVGRSSKDSSLPIGNIEWSYEKLMKLWRTTFLFVNLSGRKSTAIVVL